MNCIFICVFHQKKYIEMLYLLLESIFIYGNLGDNTIILIYTSTAFMNIIKQSHLFCEDKMIFEINNTFDSIDQACKARLNLFHLPRHVNYKKILYLDTDIIIKDEINKIFDLVEEDILYALEEGSIDSPDKSDYWGQTFFENELHKYTERSAFSSCILLFKNCEAIRILFKNIIEHMNKYSHHFNDQPHIVYNAIKSKLYNNKILKSYAINKNYNIHTNKVIHHFPWSPGACNPKINIMNIFLTSLKDFTINENIHKTKKYINTYLMPIINNSGELLEGNIFMEHHTTNYTDKFINKCKNISNLVLNKNIKNVIEIGFNSGFSTLLMLLSNPFMKITCYDLVEHSYTMPCYNQLKNFFGERIKLIVGDSRYTLKNTFGTCDLIHIDGGNLTEIVKSDIINSYRLSEQGTILIMDDYEFENLHCLWNHYIKQFNLQNLHIHIYETPHHNIKYV